jgi:hypothetical protein
VTRISARPTIPVTASTWIGCTAKTDAAANAAAADPSNSPAKSNTRSDVPAWRARFVRWNAVALNPETR